MKIIITEDERIIALGLSTLLKKLGHEILCTCTTGERCIDSVAKERPDVVFMDIRIDGPIDGIETATVVKERFGTPVIFTTAYADKATRNRAAALKPTAFLTKPVDRDSVLGALSALSA